MIFSPWPVFYSFSSCLALCSLNTFLLLKIIQQTIKKRTKSVKKSSLKTICFLTSIFSRFGLHFGGFGSLLGLSWEALGVQNGVQEGGGHWPKTVLFLTYVVFDAFFEIFSILNRFWKVWGRFWEGFGRVGDGFWEGLDSFFRSLRQAFGPRACRITSTWFWVV